MPMEQDKQVPNLTEFPLYWTARATKLRNTLGQYQNLAEHEELPPLILLHFQPFPWRKSESQTKSKSQALLCLGALGLSHGCATKASPPPLLQLHFLFPKLGLLFVSVTSTEVTPVRFTLGNQNSFGSVKCLKLLKNVLCAQEALWCNGRRAGGLVPVLTLLWLTDSLLSPYAALTHCVN